MDSAVDAAIERDKASQIDFSTPFHTSSFNDLAVLITGGASGLGEAFATMFASEGFVVVIADCDDEAGQTISTRLHDKGPGKAYFVHVNVRSWDSQVQMLKQALPLTPKSEFDILIPCAGIAGRKFDWTPVEPGILYASADDLSLEAANIPVAPTKAGSEVPREQLEGGYQHGNVSRGALPDLPAPDMKCIDVGLVGTYYSVNLLVKYGMGLHAHAPENIISLANSILLIASMASYRPLPGAPDYTAGKFGLRALLKSFRLELPKLGCRINMLAPYFVETNMTRHLIPGLAKAGVRVASMQDCVEAVKRLAHDSSINGRAVGVTADGAVDLCDDIGGHEGGDALEMLTRQGSVTVPQSASVAGP